jgi:hypothetical protein
VFQSAFDINTLHDAATTKQRTHVVAQGLVAELQDEVLLPHQELLQHAPVQDLLHLVLRYHAYKQKQGSGMAAVRNGLECFQ